MTVEKVGVHFSLFYLWLRKTRLPEHMSDFVCDFFTPLIARSVALQSASMSVFILVSKTSRADPKSWHRDPGSFTTFNRRKSSSVDGMRKAGMW